MHIFISDLDLAARGIIIPGDTRSENRQAIETWWNSPLYLENIAWKKIKKAFFLIWTQHWKFFSNYSRWARNCHYKEWMWGRGPLRKFFAVASHTFIQESNDWGMSMMQSESIQLLLDRVPIWRLWIVNLVCWNFDTWLYYLAMFKEQIACNHTDGGCNYCWSRCSHKSCISKKDPQSHQGSLWCTVPWTQACSLSKKYPANFQGLISGLQLHLKTLPTSILQLHLGICASFPMPGKQHSCSTGIGKEGPAGLSV